MILYGHLLHIGRRESETIHLETTSEVVCVLGRREVEQQQRRIIRQ
jgi:hypothetical protein